MTHAPDILSSLYVFLLATFVGLEVIKRVSPLLHTPLMSLTNAISAISIVGALLITGKAETPLSAGLGMLAVVCSMINVTGGYLITFRMIKMFKRKGAQK